MKFQRLWVVASVMLLTVGSAVPIALLNAALAVPQGAPASQPASGPASGPASRPAEETARRMRALTRTAIEQIKAGRLERAERTLRQALEIDAASPTNLYNLACVMALQGRSEAALDYLERSASA